MLTSNLLKLSLGALALGTALAQTYDTTPRELSRVVVYSPPRNFTDPQVLYARTAQLANNDLLATWENYSPEPPAVFFPIFRSSDAGATWAEISRVQDTQLGVGLRYQPVLYVLPERVGEYDEGTLLLAGSAIPTDLSFTQVRHRVND
jgi:hypothetical protein